MAHAQVSAAASSVTEWCPQPAGVFLLAVPQTELAVILEQEF